VVPAHLASVPIRPYFPTEGNGAGTSATPTQPAEADPYDDGLDPIIAEPPRRPAAGGPERPAPAAPAPATNGRRQRGPAPAPDPRLDDEPRFAEVASRPLRVSRLGPDGGPAQDLPSSPPAES
jgi:hypothetical protein